MSSKQTLRFILISLCSILISHAAEAAPSAVQPAPATPASSGGIAVQQEVESFPPIISVPNVEDGAIYNRDITPRISIKSTTLKSMAVTLDDRPYAADTPVTSEGRHRLNITAEDRSGNRSSLQMSFAIDKTPPATVMQAPGSLKGENDAIFVAGNAKVAVSAEDRGTSPSGIARTECRLDGGAPQPYEQPISMAGLADGTHTLYCLSTDRAGNRGEEQKLTLILSNSPPTTVLTLSTPHRLVADGSYMASPTTVLNLFASGSPSGIALTEYQIDNSPWLKAAPFTIPTAGSHTVRFRSTDRLGNREEPKSAAVSVDLKPPLTELHIDGVYTGNGQTAYASATAPFRLVANSPVAGILRSEYRIDNGPWINYAPFTIGSEGRHVVEFRSIDAVGNVEAAQTRHVTIDATPPATAATVDGQPAGFSTTRFTKGSNTITLKASDALSGVKATEYRIDQGPWKPYTPLQLETKESHRLEFRSTDNVGNVEESGALTIRSDLEAPVSTLEAGSPKAFVDGVLHVTGTTPFTLNAVDTASGVAKSEYRVDGGGWQTAAAPFMIGATGRHQVEFRSTDTVGNVEQPKSLQVEVGGSGPNTAVLVAGKNDPAKGDICSREPVSLLLRPSSVWQLKNTEYRIDGGDWSDYKNPVVIDGEGKHLLEYRSTDAAGNQEPAKAVTVIIDRTPPTATLAVGSPKREMDGAVQIEASTVLTPTATDDLSGVETFEYQIKGHGVENDAIPFSIATRGRYDITYWSTDRAGNKSAPQKLTVSVTAAPKQFSPEDLMLANEIASPPEIRKEAQPSPKQAAKAVETPQASRPAFPPDDEPLPKRKPEDRSFIYWTLGIIQVGLILAIMMF